MQHYYNYALLGALCVKTYQNHYRGHDWPEKETIPAFSSKKTSSEWQRKKSLSIHLQLLQHCIILRVVEEVIPNKDHHAQMAERDRKKNLIQITFFFL